METILTAVITGGLALAGVIITNMGSNRSIENKLVTAQAVTDTKIDALAEEVRKHNNFASRVPVVEEQVRGLQDRVSGIEHKLDKSK